MPTGIILLDKPRGLTSNGALQRVRKAFGAKSAGHVGTLDPMATGMLPLCLDEATKVIAEIEAGSKAYEFTVQLGARTDTGDAERPGGRKRSRCRRSMRPHSTPCWPASGVLSSRSRPCIRRSSATAARSTSWPARAWKSSGPRAPSTSRGSSCSSAGPDHLRLACECTKGTYIRVLGEDIARALGTCGHLTSLRRTVGGAVPGNAHGDAGGDAGRGEEPRESAARRSALAGDAPGAAHRRSGSGPAQWPGRVQPIATGGARGPAGAPLRAWRTVPGARRSPAGWLAATASSFIAGRVVNLCFTEPFL